MQFYHVEPSVQNQWRAIVLFGQNVASYKFALAKSLIEHSQQNQKDIIRLEDLALPYALKLCEHLKHSPKQTTSANSGKLIQACEAYNGGQITESQLQTVSLQEGFKYVLDAFHVVNRSAVPTEFFQVTNENKIKHLILTDSFAKLVEDKTTTNSLLNEVESRWNLVEKAWEFNMSRRLMGVEYDQNLQELYTVSEQRRVNITSSRGALNGYQKGKCFYCFREIGIGNHDENLADVDHFFPFTLVSKSKDFVHININGVWNLVLACQQCNRWDKSARVPSLTLLHRLFQRNEYLIYSHHPLRETLMIQTGKTTEQRQHFLQGVYQLAKQFLIHEWKPASQGGGEF